MPGQARSLLFLLWLAIVSGQVTIFQQNFDSLPSLAAQAPPTPVQSSDLSYSYVTNTQSSSSPNAAMTKGSSSITIPISTSNYNALTLSFSTRATALNPGNCSYVEYTGDGFTWYIIQTLCHGLRDNSVWYSSSVSLPTIAENNPIFAFRFRSVISSSSAYLDNIVLTGLSGGGLGVTRNGVVSRTTLTSNALLNGPISSPVNTSEFYYPPTGAPVTNAPTNNFLQGTLTLGTVGSTLPLGSGYSVLVDWYGYMNGAYKTQNQMLYLPSFSFDIYTVNIGTDTHVVPVSRGLNANTHPHYEWIIGTGRMWYEVADGSYTRVAFPISLSQRNANCVHNGMLTFIFNSGSVTSPPSSPTSAIISKAFLQITSETCDYFQANYWGLFSASLTLKNLNVGTLQSSYVTEISQRLPLRPFYMLPIDNPTANLNAYNFGNGVTQSSLSMYGLTGWQYQGTNVVYYAPGATRYGAYPWADSLIIPSYSVAKAILVSVSMMTLVQNLGSDAFLSTSLSTVCQTMTHGGTLKNALDMSTGYYTSTGYLTDENSGSTSTNFFLTETNVEKLYAGSTNNKPTSPLLGTACGYPYNNGKTGTQWIYHTSDYYMATRILENNIPGGASLSSFWNTYIATPLHLGPLIQSPRTTYTDSPPKVWGAWGIFMNVDDISKITLFLNGDEGSLGSQILSTTYLNKVMQRDTTDVGLTVPGIGSTASPYSPSNPFTYRYQLGFWAADIFNSAKSVANFPDYIPSGGYPCTDSSNTPFGKSTALSGYYTPFSIGYGGIDVAYLPNRMNFFIFSDNDEFVFAPAARESIKLRDFCTAGLY